MKLKRTILDWLLASRYYPHIYFFKVPFKTYEWFAMLRQVSFTSSHVVLDIGSGLGIQTALLAQKAGRVVGIDPYSDAVNRAKSEQSQLDPDGKVTFLCTTIEHAGFVDGQFDRIFSVCVLEHIPDHRSVLRESYRVLKAGGRVVFSVDSLATIYDAKAKARHKDRYAVCRYFEPEQLKQDFESAGFKNVQVFPVMKSTLAARWFEKAIWSEFNFGYLEAWWKYQVLRVAEWFARNKTKGIYLLVTGEK
jgi:ubiquinone/menaquinone biosynthesis C-methylase UbiE